MEWGRVSHLLNGISKFATLIKTPGRREQIANNLFCYEHMFGGGNMKIVAKPIEVVSWTDTKGNINPVRFKYCVLLFIILQVRKSL
jgi:hypothetical protein